MCPIITVALMFTASRNKWHKPGDKVYIRSGSGSAGGLMTHTRLSRTVQNGDRALGARGRSRVPSEAER